MQLVIKIPKEYENDWHESTLSEGRFSEFFVRVTTNILDDFRRDREVCGNYELETIEMLEEAFNNAVVLPKGHGRLIDADKFNQNLQSADYDTYNDYSNTFDWIETAPTIVEADKAESEDI